MKTNAQAATDGMETTRDTAQRWIRDAASLVSPPDICIRVFELVESNQATAQDLGEIIGCDPSLTARLLRLVNSSFYQFSRRIDTVSRAITVVGISELYNLVIAVSAVKSFSRIPSFVVNIDTFWRHSVSCGIIARMLAKRCGVLHPERLFVAGLLHDIGSLLIYNRVPETARDLVLAARGNETLLHRTERKALGFGHAELGGLMLDQWHLPDALQQAVRHHHEPAAADGHGRLEAAIVHIADALANHGEQGAFSAEASAELFIDEDVWETTGLSLTPDLLDMIVEETREQYRDAVNVLGF
ncbi:MAG: HDOD domain-containing protein [Gammaproteobacteria bacterium]|nr:HDOD domain-containing protein [Gammaproteobacteria bacterium]